MDSDARWVLGVIHNWIQNLVIGGKIDTIVYCFV